MSTKQETEEGLYEHKAQLQPEWQTGTSLQIHHLTGCYKSTANTKKGIPLHIEFLSKYKFIWVKRWGKIYYCWTKKVLPINLQIPKLPWMFSIWKWKCKNLVVKRGNLFFSYKHHRILQLLLLVQKNSFSEHLTLVPIFVFYKREKYTRFQKMKTDISNIFIIHLHKLLIYLVILVIIPKCLVCVVPDNRGTICLCILFPQFYP